MGQRVAWRAVPWAVALAVALAGCSGEGAGPGAADGGAAGFEEFGIPTDALALRGVVVNEAIVPQSNVTVTLDDDRTATTTESGLFAFADVAAGVHVVRANAPGLLEVTSTVSVQSADDPIVRIVMPVDAETRPYHQVLHVEMFLQCGVGTPVGVSYSTCQTPNGASDIVCDASNVCLGHPMDHNGLVEVDPGTAAPDFAQAEAVWQATNPSTERLLWSMSARGRGTIDFDNNTDFEGPSPLIMPWNKTQLEEGHIGQEKMFVFQVYPAGGDVTLVLQQQVDLFLTTFYNSSPPEGWSLSADGEPGGGGRLGRR